MLERDFEHDSSLSSLGRTAPERFVLTNGEEQYQQMFRIRDKILLVLVFLYGSWIPFLDVGFLYRSIDLWFLVEFLVDVFFIFNLFIFPFWESYVVDKATCLLVDDPAKVPFEQGITWFAFDVISAIPSALVEALLPVPFNRATRLLKLWRLRHVHSFFVRMERDLKYNYNLVRLTKVIYVTFFTLHFAACMAYFMADICSDKTKTYFSFFGSNFHKQSFFDRYVASLYWAMTVLSTVGYGDIHPVDIKEMILNIFFMFINIGLYSYLLANVNDFMLRKSSQTRKFNNSIEAARRFAKRNMLPRPLQDQMINHLRLHHRIESESVLQDIMTSFSTCLRSSISNHLFSVVIDQVYLFQGVSEAVKQELASKITVEYLNPGVEVILRNRAPTCFYILVTGALEVSIVNYGDDRVNRHQTQALEVIGSVVGEIGVLTNRPHQWTVRTMSLSQVICVDRSVLVHILQSRAGRDGYIMSQNLLQELERSPIQAVQEVAATIHAMPAGDIGPPFEQDQMQVM